MNNPAATLAALQRIVAVQRFTSATSFELAGRAHGIAPPYLASLSPQAQPIVATLRDALYEQAYIKPLDAPAPVPYPARPGFAQALYQANTSRDRWHDGWQIEAALPAGQVRARRHDLVRTLWPGEYVVRNGVPQRLQPRTDIVVFQARESQAMQSGFYFAFGEAQPDEEDEAQLLRLYWHLKPTGAPTLLSTLSRMLNRFEIPFRFKCVNAAEHYGRSDAAVLYVARRYYRVLAELLPMLTNPLTAQQLGDATPLFALRLAPGVALAEDPLGGESFGMHRCRLLAEALWAAHNEGLANDADRLDRVRRHFEAAGIPLHRTHLNPGSTLELLS